MGRQPGGGDGAAGVSGWILDLRLSTGRSLSTLQRVAGVFLPPDTPVATTRGVEGGPTALGSMGTPLVDQKPLVVMIGPGTVAAAEVLAQTLHDAGRATVVGSQSAGCVNDGPRYGLLDGGGVVIAATGVYAGASQTPLEDTGVSPDVPVERSAADLAAGEDPQLDAALARSFPDLAAARSELPAVLARYDTRLHIRVAGAPDLRKLRPFPLEAIAWGSVVFGVLVAALSAFGLATDRLGGRIRPAAPLPGEGRG